MIIYNIKGEKIHDVLVTKGAVHEEELMKKNLVRLSWRDVEKRTFDVGTYIKPFADKGDDTPYFLFQPYEAEQVNEVEYKCEPEFQHPTMYLGYVPYVNKTKNYDGQDITKLDWSYVGGTAELLADVCKAINAALKDANLLSDGEEFRVEVISTNNVAIKDTTNVTFASVDILSALNQIAQYNECEWHLAWEDKTLHFGDITIGDDVDEVILQVDENIGVASIRNDKEGFWNVFYPQGGTKNMTRQMSADEYIHSNERLMLDKTAYPDGMIYTDENGNVKTAEEFAALGQKKIVKVLTFDDIYPKLTLYMYRLRERLRTRFKDEEHTDPYITGTDENGNPIYEKYADWYFRLAYPIKDENGNIIDWKDFDGLTARTPKALIQNVNDNKVRLRVPFVAGKDFYTNSDGTVTATIDDVSVVATIGGMTGDAAQPDLTIEKTTPNYGRFMQKVIDGATDMALSAGIDTAVWCECAATRGELDEYTYTKSLIVNGEKIGAAFGVNPNSDAYQSRLAGREFELDYYDTNQTIEETEHDTGIVIEPGDYHIIREDGDIIIPTTSNGGIYPQADWKENIKNNTLSLFNIVMTDDYKKSAQNDLANATLQEIKYYHTDLRTYTVKSNPVEFAKKNPNLYIGRKVTYKDLKGYTLETRVMALTTQLDFPIEQTISMGNLVIKGTQQQLKEDVKTIISGNGGGGVTLNKSAVESIIKQYSDKRYLSKLNDDTAKGEITFEKGAKFGQSNGINEQGNATLNDVTASKYKGKNGVVNLDGDTEITGGMSVDGDTVLDGILEVHGNTQHDKSVTYGNYTGAGVLDTGAAMLVDPNTEETTLIVDYARFRKKAEFTEITVAELKSVGGEIIISPAHMVIAKVDVLDTGDYKCYFQTSDGDRTIKNQFAVDDQARCQVFNLGSGSRYYWRLVTEVGTDYIVLSATDCNGTDIPQVGDNLCQLGNRTDTTRQSAIILSAYGADAPSRKSYQGINSYDLTNCLAYGESYNPITGRNKSEIYGDAYIGDKQKNEYIEYTQEDGLRVKGKVDVQMGANNLILNSSFKGDYTSDTFSEDTLLGEESEVSATLTHWSYENVEIVSESGSYCKSGNAAVLTNGWLEQQVNNPPKSTAYVLSFSAKGEGDLVVLVNTTRDEYLRTISLNESWSRYSVDIKATSSEYIRVFLSATNAVICDIQLERGYNVTDWKPSEDDADDALHEMQTYAYLLDAIRNGSTSILGGLIMSKMLMLGNYKNGKLQRNTAGISGIYNNDDDVVLWGGGSYHDAIRIVAKFKNNPAYNPTEDEWQKLAKFAVTHGGDVFMRGYIHALGGYFRGMVDIADGKIRLNPDGSGHLAGGNIRWNTQGKAEFDGAVNAETLYRGVCLVWDNQTYLLLNKDGNYKTPVCLANKEDLIYFVDSNLFGEDNFNELMSSINSTDEGATFYWGEDYYFSITLAEMGYQPREITGINACTGGADIVLLQNNAYTEFATETIVYIPRAQDYVGKLIEVVNPKKNVVEAENYVFIHQADDAKTFVLGLELKDGEIEIFNKFNSITIGSGTTRFYSDGTYWIKL